MILLAFFAGCEPRGAPTPDSFAVRDSAGIRIATSMAPAWGAGEEWMVEAEPLLQIGVHEGHPAYQFSNIWAATRHPDGRIAVVERAPTEIRIFGVDGNHLTSIGRSGAGPGEFQILPYTVWASADTILTWDAGSSRLSWFSDRGPLLRERSLSDLLIRNSLTNRGSQASLWLLLPYGGLVSNGSGGQTTGVPPVTQWTGTQVLHYIPAGGDTVVPLGVYPGSVSYMVSATTGPVSFFVGNRLLRAPTTPAIRRDPLTIYITQKDEWEITGVGPDASLTEILRAAVPRTPITPEMVEVERERARATAETAQVAPGMMLGVFARYEIADSLPAIGSVQIDGQGNLWVARRARPGDPQFKLVDVLDREGRWLGTVAPPEDLGRVLEIGDDYLLTAWSDELGVQYLRVYGIRKD